MKKTALFLAMMAFANTAQAKPYLDIQELHPAKNISVWFVQDKNIPVMTLKFSLKGGSQFDPAGKEGSAQLLSSLFDEGAGKRNGEAFQDLEQSNGIKMGFTATHDAFYGSLKTTSAKQDLAIGMFDDALNKPHFAPEAIARMKADLQSNLRFSLMDPNYQASQKLFATLFAGQPYARPVEGDAKSVAAITRDDLVKEKTTLFCQQRLKVAIVGNLDADQVTKMVDRLFGNWPQCVDKVDNVIYPVKNLGQEIHIPWQGAQSIVMMAQPGMARQNKDWWAGRILDFALGAGEFSSRLMNEVRVKRGLTYGVSSSLAPYDHAPLWVIEAGVEPAKATEAIALIKKVWGDVAANGLTVAEITEAKDHLIGSLPLALTSTDAIAGIVLQLQEDDLPKTTLDTRAAEINAVTADDIKRVAKQYVQAAQLTTVIAGPTTEKK
jgi:zinc protease